MTTDAAIFRGFPLPLPVTNHRTFRHAHILIHSA